MLEEQDELRALTLWRPWDQAILYGGKRIENRPWVPWAKVLGKVIGLHAGMKYDRDGALWMLEKKLYVPPSPSCSNPGVIVGLARVVDCVVSSDDPWFSGPFGWMLDDVVALEKPVKAKGMQGLWRVDGEALEQIQEQI